MLIFNNKSGIVVRVAQEEREEKGSKRKRKIHVIYRLRMLDVVFCTPSPLAQLALHAIMLYKLMEVTMERLFRGIRNFSAKEFKIFLLRKDHYNNVCGQNVCRRGTQ